MISMNRITKLIHRVKFNARQRRTISYFKKFVISKDDVIKNQEKKKREKLAKISKTNEEALDVGIVNRKLLKRFDPEDDKWDRRALFEVTGIRLYDGDFLESDTSDEET